MNTKDLFSLKGRIALVSGGAGSGFGSQISRALAESGAKVFIGSRSLDKSKALAEEICKEGLEADGIALDVTDEDSVKSAVDQALNVNGRIDILVNSAAINHLEPFEKISMKDWERVFRVNVGGAMLLARQAASSMLKHKSGTVINISSIYGMVSPDQGIYGDSGINSPLVYGASKAALLQMTRYWATYWAPNIRVNSITPGGLFAHQDPGFVSNYVRKTPLGRMAGQNDLKGAVVYLASDASAWVTGHNLVVDGGWTAW